MLSTQAVPRAVEIVRNTSQTAPNRCGNCRQKDNNIMQCLFNANTPAICSSREIRRCVPEPTNVRRRRGTKEATGFKFDGNYDDKDVSYDEGGDLDDTGDENNDENVVAQPPATAASSCCSSRVMWVQESINITQYKQHEVWFGSMH